MTASRRASAILSATLCGAVTAGCDQPIFPSRDSLTRQTLARFDGNGDGVIDAAEYESCAGHELPFHEYDMDGSGGIDSAELDYQLLRRQPRPLVDHRLGNDQRAVSQPNELVEQREGTLP